MEEKRGGPSLAAWAGFVLTFIVSLGGVVYTFGAQANRIANLEQQMTDLRSESRTAARDLAEIKDTTTVIKTKLEILLPTATVAGKEAG